MNIFVDTVKDRIQKAILTAIDNVVAPKIELAIRSINASSGRDVTSVSVNSERREHVGIDPPFENASENNNTLKTTNINDETRHNTNDEASEKSVPGTHFHRQPQTHHNAQFLQPDVNDQLRKFWEIEEIPNASVLTEEEKECERHFIETTTRQEDSRFVVSVPFKPDSKSLGQSLPKAINRFRSLERKFQQDGNLKQR